MPSLADHLTDRDRALLARATGPAQPTDLDRALDDPAVFAAVFGDEERGDPLLRVSPFLLFAVALARTALDLEHERSVAEWVGPRQRVPVLGTGELREVLDDRGRRVFLAALLASYTHVASGSVWVQTRRGPRRQRYSELDLLRLASLLDAVPEQARPGVQRRLGDLALFLTGVFPDHTATRLFRPLDLQRLARAVRPSGERPAPVERLVEALEVRGAVGFVEQLGERWYRLAGVDEVADRFQACRRVLNQVTDRVLFPHRAVWFPGAA